MHNNFEPLETIKIKHGDDFMIINKVDFDSEIHEIFGEKKEVGAKIPKSKGDMVAFAKERFGVDLDEGEKADILREKIEKLLADEAAGNTGGEA